jgi:hypothetical protein
MDQAVDDFANEISILESRQHNEVERKSERQVEGSLLPV